MNMKLQSLIIVALVLVSGAVRAADDKGSAAKAQLRQVQQEKHKLEQDKAQLEQDKAALDTQLKAAQDSLATVKKSADSSGYRSSTLQKELEAAKAEKAELATKLSAVQTQLEQSQGQLQVALRERQAVDASRTQIQTSLTQQNQSLEACQSKNQEQYKANLELLDKYEKKSCFSAMLQREPFFGLGKTKLENEVADYKERFEKQHLEPASEVSTAP